MAQVLSSLTNKTESLGKKYDLHAEFLEKKSFFPEDLEAQNWPEFRKIILRELLSVEELGSEGS